MCVFTRPRHRCLLLGSVLLLRGAFVYAGLPQMIVRLLHLQKRLQRSFPFVYAGIHPICAVNSKILLWMLCSQYCDYCVNERTFIMINKKIVYACVLKIKNEFFLSKLRLRRVRMNSFQLILQK